MYAKLDGYDYELHYNEEGRLDEIRVRVDSNKDVIIADISTEINANDGKIYIEGYYTVLVKMAVLKDMLDEYWVIIEVSELEEE